MVLGAVSKGRSSSRKINFLLRTLGFWCFACDIALVLVLGAYLNKSGRCPFTRESIESWYASLPRLPPQPTAVFATAHALSVLGLLWEPLSVAAHTAGERVRKLESSDAFSYSKAKPAYVEDAGSQVTYVGEDSSAPLPRKGVKNGWNRLRPHIMLVSP